MAEEQAVPSPRRSRPYVRGYGIPEREDGMLAWQEVSRRIEQARNYWLGTTGADGQPHAVPLWGIWLDDTLYFDGAPHTRWARNLAANPKVVVHLESGDEVVILEGTVVDIPRLDPAVFERVARASAEKYGGPFEDHGCFTLRPRTAYAWASFPADATRFTFDGD